MWGGQNVMWSPATFHTHKCRPIDRSTLSMAACVCVKRPGQDRPRVCPGPLFFCFRIRSVSRLCHAFCWTLSLNIFAHLKGQTETEGESYASVHWIRVNKSDTFQQHTISTRQTRSEVSPRSCRSVRWQLDGLVNAKHLSFLDSWTGWY